MMRIAMYYGNDDVRIEEMTVPDIGPGEILMRVESSGICGSDVMEWYRRHKVPLVLGHEVAGTIEKAAQDISLYKKGDRITAFHHVPCDTCHWCRMGHSTVCDTLRTTNFIPGGFSEYLKLSPVHVQKGILKLPGSVSFDEATFVEPLACVLRGQHMAGVSSGKTVLVIGSGISGLLHIAAASAHGADAVIATDIDEFRLRAAKKFGAKEAFHASQDIVSCIKNITGGRLADIVIICAGARSVFEQALKAIDRGGCILVFSAADEGLNISLPVNEIFWRNETTITSSYAGSPADCADALEWIARKKIPVSDMITHRLPLDGINKGFQLVASHRESIKVIIKPQIKLNIKNQNSK